MPEQPSPARALFATYLRPHRRLVAALAGALLAGTALPLAGPQLLRRFVDEATAGASTSSLVPLAAAYLAVVCSAQVVNVGATFAASTLAWSATNALREDLVDHMLGLDLAFHAEHTPGELIERVDGDVTALADFVARFLLQLLGSALLLVGAVVLVLREDARVAAVLVAFLAVASLVLVRVQRAATPRAEAERDAAAAFVGFVEERLDGAEDLRSLGAADHTMVRFHEAASAAWRADQRAQQYAGGLIVATNFVFALGTALMLAAGVVLLRRGSMTLGTVLLLFQYTAMVRAPVERVVDQFKDLQKAAAGAARVIELLRRRPDIAERPAAVPISGDGALDVRLEGVTFAYPGDRQSPVLHDVSLTVAAGRSLGLVGRTGSGKSTIARLLLRLYESDTGRVLIDGVDVRDVEQASLRRRVRLVTQDVQLFEASLRDNLTVFGAGSRAGDDAMIDTLDALGLGSWVRSLPAGLDTPLGAAGVGVSAGEGQLLAFARVFLADPGLVILDEASSRLDPATEALVEAATRRLLEGRTVVVIAHRLSSLRIVDDIVVLDAGRIVEHGPRQLLAADPASRYGRLVRLVESSAP
ncbi:MAG TPA: ABC transporter ATP-binding protein [Acidimicrobiales bacterium]|nr:ABC transporter ATP-binding protein [Acidimicrobiales bacterium]